MRIEREKYRNSDKKVNYIGRYEEQESLTTQQEGIKNAFAKEGRLKILT